ncbi:hypothetical protein VTN02DRAFT_2774 [Thermoascus thermophilus]
MDRMHTTTPPQLPVRPPSASELGLDALSPNSDPDRAKCLHVLDILPRLTAHRHGRPDEGGFGGSRR